MNDQLTLEQKTQAWRVIKPMLEVINTMSPEDMWLAMQGFYNVEEDNGPWQMFALRHALPLLITTSASARGIDMMTVLRDREIK